MQKKAVILFSGGLDSTTCLALAAADGFACYALSFDYGQRHAHELVAARLIADKFSVVEHQIMPINLAGFGGSALTDFRVQINGGCSQCETNVDNSPWIADFIQTCFSVSAHFWCLPFTQEIENHALLPKTMLCHTNLQRQSREKIRRY